MGRVARAKVLSKRAVREQERLNALLRSCPPPAGAPGAAVCPECGLMVNIYGATEVCSEVPVARFVEHRTHARGRPWCPHSNVALPEPIGPERPPKEAWATPYEWCHICGKRLPPLMEEMAKRRYHRVACSDKCRDFELKRRICCCQKAEWIGCVCAWSWRCPEHGEHHVGTHD